ncbi:MAG: hypothetical protein IJ627_03150 [Bacteroidales bacterium]|nr:hypothetical protein [Bacteroidales bacterium]
MTWPYWKPLESAEILELLAVYREYILSAFKADGLNVPPGRVAETWKHCRVIIDKEITEAEP